MGYLLDSDVLIAAKEHYYPFDYCPGFWECLVRENANGHVLSIKSVYDELIGRADELSNWVRTTGRPLFVAEDQASIVQIGHVSNHVNSLGAPITEPNKREFLRGADPRLVAYARAHGHTVVTMEALVAANCKVVKIPNVCRDLNVDSVNVFHMLRALNISFVLGQ